MLSPCALPDTATPGPYLSPVLLTDAADSLDGKSPPGPKPPATAAAGTARHGHSSTFSLHHPQHSVHSSMDGVRLPRSPTGISRSLTPWVKAADHQHQQSINYQPLQSSDMFTQLLVTAAIVTGQDPKPLPSDARDSRLNEPAATHVARSDFPPESTTTIDSSWRCAPTAPDGAASASNASRLVAHSTSTQPHLSSTIAQRDASFRCICVCGPFVDALSG